MNSLLALLVLAAGLALVVAGAELFFKGLLASAAHFGVSPFILAIVVSGFELENLAAGVAANAKGLPGAAAGTFLGGTTFLALAVTGLAALVAPMRATLPRPLLAWVATSALPLLALSLDGELSRLDGGLLLAWFAVLLVGLVRSGRTVLENRQPPSRRRAPLLRLVGGLAVLAAGGEILGEGIRSVVTRFGVSDTLLGNTAIAASVEAEEFGRVAVPARRGRVDIALANIAGTLAHFVAFNAGVIALVKPIEIKGESLWLHLPVAVAATSLVSLVIAAGNGVGRAAGAALLTLYAGYLAAAIAVAV